MLRVPANDEAVRIALQVLEAQYGGTLVIGPGLIEPTEPYIPFNGLTVACSGWGYGNSSGWDEAANGTRFLGDGTFDCWKWNDVDNPDATAGGNPSPYTTAMLKNFHFRGGAFKNFRRAFSIGARNRSGCMSSSIRDTAIYQCTDWGIVVDNSPQFYGDGIFCYQNTVGGIRHVTSTPAIDLGNSKLSRITAVGVTSGGVSKARGIVIGGDGASINMIVLDDVEAFGGSGVTRYDTTATITNGSANIAVSDISRFRVGMPVSFSSTVGNITGASTKAPHYFILSVSGSSGSGSFTIGTLQGTTSSLVTASASGTPTVRTRGQVPLEIVGMNGGGARAITVNGVDIEDPGQGCILLQSTRDTHIVTGIVGAASDTISARLIARHASNFANQNHIWFGSEGDLDDIDNASVSLGVHGGRATNVVSGGGVGITTSYADFSGFLDLTGNRIGLRQSRTNNVFTFDANVALAQSQVTTGGNVGSYNNGSLHYYNSGTSGSVGLPTAITANGGMFKWWSNPQASGVTMTLTTGGSQLINNQSGTTSLEVPGKWMAVTSFVNPAGFYVAAGVIPPKAGQVPVAPLVSNLPTASAHKACQYYVTDANSPSAGATVSGGGSTEALVCSNGSAWKVVAVMT
jgi:hypothetical protein